jgi:ATP-dependent Clp protease ATP-binding subunit ClpA
MPKISVYVPEDLAERLKEAKLSVSAICQAALERALQRAAEAGAALVVRDPALPADLQLDLPVVSHFVDAITFAYEAAASRGSLSVEPEDLLQGILDEGENLVLKTVEAIGVSREKLITALREEASVSEPVATDAVSLSDRARGIIDAAADAARKDQAPLNLGYLLVAIADDTTSVAATVMRRNRLDAVALRGAVAAMQSGVAFARADPSGSSLELAVTLATIDQRLGRIEAALSGSPAI